jgi:hypothetical protein
MIVARVSRQAGGGAGALPAADLGIDPEPLGIALGAVVLFAISSALAARRAPAPAWRRALAAGLAGTLLVGPGASTVAWAAAKGDTNLDQDVAGWA